MHNVSHAQQKWLRWSFVTACESQEMVKLSAETNANSPESLYGDDPALTYEKYVYLVACKSSVVLLAVIPLPYSN